MKDIVRPSTLARAWKVHPRTVTLWIQSGRLPALKTPGGQFRVRVADVPEFCAKERLAVPPELMRTAREVGLFARKTAVPKAAQRVLEGTRVLAFADPFAGLAHVVASPPLLIIIEAPFADPEALVRAIRRSVPTARVPIVVFDATSAPRAEKILRRGATFVLTKKARAELAPRLAELLERASR